MREKLKDLVFPAFLLAAFWTLAVTLTLTTGRLFWLFNFGYIGTSLAVGSAVYALLPRRKKPAGRKLAQFLVGLYMLGYLGLYLGENMQIEGFFLYLSAGFFGGALIHYLVAKVLGPLLFGRGFCSWACWTAMVLDLLPFHRPAREVNPRWQRLRYVHFAFSLGLVLALVPAFVHGEGGKGLALAWLIAGNTLYYATGALLAFWLKDNRAFCKYVCPVSVPMKAGARFSLLKVGAGDPRSCNGCGACNRVCPMSVDVRAFVTRGERVLSTECILCETCVSACPKGTLQMSFRPSAGRVGHRVEMPVGGALPSAG